MKPTAKDQRRVYLANQRRVNYQNAVANDPQSVKLFEESLVGRIRRYS